MGIVYGHINKINNKIYIGISEHDDANLRWGANGNGYIGSEFFNKGIKPYGWDNFEHLILFEKINKSDAEQIEARIIKLMNLTNESIGYNVHKGVNVVDNPLYDLLAQNAITIIKEHLSTLNHFDISTFMDEISSDYVYATNSYSLDYIFDRWNKSLISTDLDCQRDIVWDSPREQLMWDTLLKNQIIPEIHAIINKDIWDIADGKQRLTTITRILKDEVPFLRTSAKPEFYPLFDNLNQKKIYFSELPEVLQNRIKHIQIRICEYKNITPKGITILFQKLNSGVQLGEFEKGIANNIIIKTNYTRNLNLHPFFQQNKYVASEAGIDKVLVKSLLLTHYGLGVKNIAPLEMPKLYSVFNESNLVKYNDLIHNVLDRLYNNNIIMTELNEARSTQTILPIIIAKLARGEWSLNFIEQKSTKFKNVKGKSLSGGNGQACQKKIITFIESDCDEML